MLRLLILMGLLILNLSVYATVIEGSVPPDFHLTDQFGSSHQLKDYHGTWLLIYFYPKDGTKGCTLEAERFRDLYPVLQSHHLNIIGISEDSTEAHAHFAHALQLPFPILVDSTGQVARHYGVLNNLIITRFASRQSFLINPAGILVRHYAHVDPATHATQVLHDVVRLQGGH